MVFSSGPRIQVASECAGGARTNTGDEGGPTAVSSQLFTRVGAKCFYMGRSRRNEWLGGSETTQQAGADVPKNWWGGNKVSGRVGRCRGPAPVCPPRRDAASWSCRNTEQAVLAAPSSQPGEREEGAIGWLCRSAQHNQGDAIKSTASAGLQRAHVSPLYSMLLIQNAADILPQAHIGVLTNYTRCDFNDPWHRDPVGERPPMASENHPENVG